MIAVPKRDLRRAAPFTALASTLGSLPTRSKAQAYEFRSGQAIADCRVELHGRQNTAIMGRQELP